jgi:hypothetical protein
VIGDDMRWSLEQAWQRYRLGLLSPSSALWFSSNAPCECGNSDGFSCFNSDHHEWRRVMSLAFVEEPHPVEPPVFDACDVCACVGCSEGNCCEHEGI